MNQEDDASYKLLFSAPELVRDLVIGFIPDEWLHGLDYDIPWRKYLEAT